MKTLSFQQLKAYLLCPQLYEFTYIRRVPVFESPKIFQRGLDFHEVLDRDFKTLHQTPSFSDHEQAMWGFYLEFKNEFETLTGWSEWPFYLPLELKTESVILQGRLDRIFLKDNTLILIDWKTGPAQVWDTWQMEFYSWVLWQMKKKYFPEIENITTYSVYLSEKRSVKKDYNHGSLHPLHKKFVAILKKMNPEHYRFIPQPIEQNGSLWCQRCNFKKTCKKGQTYSEKPHLSL